MRITEFLWRGAYLLTRPDYMARAVLRRFPQGGASFATRLEWDAVDPPPYAYGVHQAAVAAKMLGLKRISAIEFGVAGGNGLVALEKIAEEVTRELEVVIDVYGFDTGIGLPPPADYRDIPYLFSFGDYVMDEAKLRGRLKRAQLILGPARETVPEFLNSAKPAPIGFVSFDLDYYSSTMEAFTLWEGEHSCFLPRVLCYFDDLSPGISQHAGEFLAISDFNASHPEKKIDPIRWLSFTRRIPSFWNQQMYLMHDFRHPNYSRPNDPASVSRQLPLIR